MNFMRKHYCDWKFQNFATSPIQNIRRTREADKSNFFWLSCTEKIRRFARSFLLPLQPKWVLYFIDKYKKIIIVLTHTSFLNENNRTIWTLFVDISNSCVLERQICVTDNRHEGRRDHQSIFRDLSYDCGIAGSMNVLTTKKSKVFCCDNYLYGEDLETARHRWKRVNNDWRKSIYASPVIDSLYR